MPRRSKQQHCHPGLRAGVHCQWWRIPRIYNGSRLGGRDDNGISISVHARARDAVISPRDSVSSEIGYG